MPPSPPPPFWGLQAPGQGQALHLRRHSSPATRFTAPWCAPRCWSVRPSRTAPSTPALDIGTGTVCPDTACPNLHAGDLVAYNTKTGSYLYPGRPSRPAGGIPPLHRQTASSSSARTAKPGDDIKPVINADDHVVEFEITPTGPTACPSSAWPGRPAATFDAVLSRCTSR